MKFLNIKYIISISFIIIIAILCLTFINTKETEKEEVPKKATLVFQSELGGIVDGEG